MLSFHVTPQITSPVIRFGCQSECASHYPNALTIRMRKPSKHSGRRVPPCSSSYQLFGSVRRYRSRVSHLTSLFNFSGSNYSCKTFGKTEVLLYIIVENTEICRPVTLRWLGLPTSSSNSLRSGIQMPTSLFVKCRFADKHHVQGLICQWTDFARSVMPTGISDKMRFANGHL